MSPGSLVTERRQRRSSISLSSMSISNCSGFMLSSFFWPLRRETLLEQRLLGLVASQREGPQLGCLGLLAPTKFKEEFSTDGVEEMIPVEITREGFDLGQCCFWPGHIAQGDRSVQPHDRRGRHLKQEIVEGQDLRPVRGLPRSCLSMAGHQRSLNLIGARTSQRRRLLNQ